MKKVLLVLLIILVSVLAPAIKATTFADGGPPPLVIG
jgi:predicted S18 family serine protease